MQRGDARQQVDELAARRRGRPGGLHFVPPPRGWGARRSHGVDYQVSPRWRVAKMPLTGRWGEGTVARVQGLEEPCGRAVDTQPICV